MINLVTVCTDKYPIIYAEKLHKQFKKLSNLEVTHYCITDRPSELPDFIKPIYPFKKSKGWWNKLNLFSSDMPPGNILYMDLDIVILHNFDDEISAMLKREESICCVSDAINWMDTKFSSSFMLFKSGVHKRIFKNFVENEKDINNNKGGDQVWTAPQIKSIFYIVKIIGKHSRHFRIYNTRKNQKK